MRHAPFGYSLMDDILLPQEPLKYFSAFNFPSRRIARRDGWSLAVEGCKLTALSSPLVMLTQFRGGILGHCFQQLLD